MEVTETSADVVPQHLPSLVRDLHAVLVLEKRDRLLRALAIAAAPREAPLVAHPPYGVLDKPYFRQRLPGVEGPQHELHRRMHGSPGPALPTRELLEDVEPRDGGWRGRLPAAPGPVVVVVVAAAALVEHARPGTRPGEDVREVRHPPEHSTRLDRLRASLVPRQAPSRPTTPARDLARRQLHDDP